MNKKLVSVIIIIVALMIVGASSWYARGWWENKDTQSAYDTASIAAQNIDSGKVSKTYQNASEEFKSLITEDQFKESVASLSGEELSVKEIGKAYEGAEDFLNIFDLQDAKKEVKGTLTIYMLKENGKWVVTDLYVTK